jgi:hypothetical protein
MDIDIFAHEDLTPLIIAVTDRDTPFPDGDKLISNFVTQMISRLFD